MLSGSFVTSTQRSTGCRGAGSEPSSGEQLPGYDTNSKCSDLTRRVVGIFDMPGLFVVGLDRPRVMRPAGKILEPIGHKRLGRARERRGLNRYCSGCAHETEHVAWSTDGKASIPTIRWPGGEPPSNTTICVDCGQWRAASVQLRLSTWSSWPREPIAMHARVIPAAATRSADAWAFDAA